MKKVSDKQRAVIEEIYGQLRDKETELDSEVQVCNCEIESALESLNDSVTGYNDLVDELNEAVSEVLDDILEFTDSKSQKWRGSDVGLAHAEWAECFENEVEHADDPMDQCIEVTVDLWHGKVDDYEWEVRED
jgi:chromosome segregation ATPase